MEHIDRHKIQEGDGFFSKFSKLALASSSGKRIENNTST